MTTIADQLRAIAAQLDLQGATPVPSGAVGSLGQAPEGWTAPVSPWPIDVRFLSAAQVASLNAEQVSRANQWQQALISSAMAGNGQDVVPAAVRLYRLGYVSGTDTSAMPAPWPDIFKAYGMTP